MPTFKHGANKVVADEPEPRDVFVRVTWFGPPQDGKHLKQFHGPILPIYRYDEAVAWAREMAEQMVFPLYVLPLTGVEVLRTEQVQRGVANLTDQQRGELRRLLVTTLAEVMRDCAKPDVRAAAFDVLAEMGVVQRDR